MNKIYILDTNVLLEDENAITVLRNGQENRIIIPEVVLLELDALKKTNKNSLVRKAVSALEDSLSFIEILPTTYDGSISVDRQLLKDIQLSDIEGTLVTNDRLFRINAALNNIPSEPYLQSSPVLAESELFNGISETEINSFVYKEGQCYFRDSKHKEKRIINYKDIWTVTPNSQTQLMAFNLLLKPTIDIISIQSVAGMGKTYVTLASALYLTFQLKQYKKIIVVRPTHEQGKELGFLPGNLDEKMFPFSRPIYDLLEQLNDLRPISDLYKEDGTLNKRKVEVIPLNFLRGANIKDTFLILDEVQNISRNELRTILTRCCDNVKVVLLGDINQVDNPILNKFNNGLNWAVQKLKGFDNYAHLTLTGQTSRGPICDTVLKSRL